MFPVNNNSLFNKINLFRQDEIKDGLFKPKPKAKVKLPQKTHSASKKQGPKPINLSDIKFEKKNLEQEMIKLDKELELENVHLFFRFFQTLKNKLNRLFSFLSHKPPQTIDMRLVNQLVRGDITTEVECPQSICYRYAYEFIKKENESYRLNHLGQEPNAADVHLEKVLKDAYVFAKKMEQFRENQKFRLDSKEWLRHLAQTEDEIAKMKEGEKQLIPGGWQKDDGQFSEAIYEIEKINETYNVKILSLDTDYQHYLEAEHQILSEKLKFQPVLVYEKVQLNDLINSISPLMQIQLPKSHFTNVKEKNGLVGKGLKTIRKLFASADEAQEKTSELTPLHIMSKCYHDASLKAASNSKSVNILESKATSKTFLVYLKQTDPENYKKKKVKLELAVFIQFVNENSSGILRNPAMRELVYTSAKKLIHEIKKNEEELGIGGSEFLKVIGDLQTIVETVRNAERKIEKIQVPNLKQESFQDQFNLAPVVDPSKMTALKSVHKNKSAEVTFVDLKINRSVPRELEDKQIETLALIEQQLVCINTLYNQKNYEAVSLMIQDMVQQLPPPPKIIGTHYWTGMSGDNLIKWSNIVFEMSQYLFDCQQLHDPVLSPEKIVSQAYLLAIADGIMYKRQSYVDFHNCYRFDVKGLNELLENDTYFRALPANQHRMAADVLNYMNKMDDDLRKSNFPTRLLIQLHNLDYIQTYSDLKIAHKFDPSGNDLKNDDQYKNADDNFKTYVEKYAEAEYKYLIHILTNSETTGKFTSDLFSEIDVSSALNTITPKEIIQVRKMSLMMQGMLCNQHAFKISSKKEFLNAGMQMMADSGKNLEELSQKEMWQQLWKIQDAKVRSNFIQNEPKIKQGKREHIQYSVNESGAIVIEPSGIIFDLDLFEEWKKWHGEVNPFKSCGRYLDSSVDDRIVNFQVGTINENDCHQTQQSLLNTSKTQEEKILRSMQMEETRLEQTFATFSQHPELLKESSYQRLFEMNMFKQGKLLDKIQSQPQFALELIHFAETNFKLCSATNDVDLALFFLNLRGQLKDYIEISSIEAAIKTDILDKIRSSLEDYEELKKQCYTADQKREVYAWQMAYYLNEIKAQRLDLSEANLDLQDTVIEIAKGYFLYNSLNPGVDKRNSDLDRQILELMERIKPCMTNYLNNEDFKKRMVAELNGVLNFDQLPKTISVKGSYPTLRYKDISIDFKKGLLFQKGLAKTILPDSILTHVDFKALFANEQTKQLQLEKGVFVTFKLNPITRKYCTIYTFAADKNMRVIVNADEALTFQKRMKSSPGLFNRMKWFELINFDADHSNQKNAHHGLPGEMSDLAFDCLVWRSIAKPTHLVLKDRQDQNYLYDVNLKANEDAYLLKSVRRFSDGLFLVNPWTVKQELGSIENFEDISHIKAWGDNSHIKEIEFPRMQLSDGKALVYTIENRKVDGKNQPVFVPKNNKSSFVPFIQSPLTVDLYGQNKKIEVLPHTFKQFQVMSDLNTGAKKVLIPYQEFIRLDKKASKNSTVLKYANWLDKATLDNKKDSFTKQRVFEFEFDSYSNTLKTDSKEGNLYLAYLFFTHKHYEQGLEFLQRSRTGLALSGSHRNLFQLIDQWPDETAEGSVFKLKALLNLKGNASVQAPNQFSEQALIEALRLEKLNEQVKKNKHTLSSKLELNEVEKNLYKSLMGRTHLPIMEKQLLEKDSEIIAATPFKTREMGSSKGSVNFKQLSKNLFIEMDSKRLPEDFFNLRNDEIFTKHFKTLYNTVLSGIATPGDLKYKNAKRLIKLAQLDSTTAQSAQIVLQALVIQAELVEKKIHPEMNDRSKKQLAFEEMENFTFPDAFKQPFFKFKRVFESGQPNDSIDALEDLFKRLLPNGAKIEKSQKLPNDKFDHLTKQERKVNIFLLEVPPDTQEVIDICAVNHELKEKNIDIRESSSNEVLTELKKMRKLELIQKDRRVSELKSRSKKINAYFKAHPVKDEIKKDNINIIVNYSTNLIDDIADINISFFEVRENVIVDDHLSAHKLEMSQFFDQYKSDDLVEMGVRHLADKYQEDTVHFIENHKTSTVNFKKRISLKQLTRQVENKFETTSTRRNDVEKDILSSIRSVQDSSLSNTTLEIIPQRLIGLYIDGKIADVNKLYHLSLSDEALKALEKNIEQWMMLTIKERTLEKTVYQLRTMTKKSARQPETAKDIYDQLNVKRFFCTDVDHAHPNYRALLAIEFATGFVLRENQVETVNAMLEKPNLVKQLGMGQGKSSVILPMLLHNIADGTKLAMGILPEWLYEIVSKDLDKNSLALFGQKITKFEFDRNTAMDVEWLLETQVNLGDSIINKHALVTTKTYLLSFRNKYLELLKSSKDPSIKEEELQTVLVQLQLMANIISLIKERGYALADEVDTILNGRDELNYAIGSPDKMNPINYEIGLQLFEKLLSLPQCANFADRLKKNERVFKDKDELQLIQNSIAKSFYSDWNALGQEGLGKVDVDIELFCAYVRGETQLDCEMKDDMPEFMSGLKNTDLFNQITALRQFLASTLETSFSHNGKVHYGRAADGANTIIYKANNTPSEADFGEEFEKIAHTIQDYIQFGLSDTQIRAWVNGMMADINREMYAQMIQTGQMGELGKTTTHIKFHEAFPHIDLVRLNQDAAYFKDFTKGLNEKNSHQLNFLKEYIFPNLQMANHQVSSNPNDLVDMVKAFSGFTGTDWNVNSYSTQIDISKTQTKGTDGKSIELLLKMEKQGQLGIRTISLDPERPLHSIIERYPDFLQKYDALIDAGFYLKGVENEDVVEILGQVAKKGSKEAVVFVTKQNEKVIQSFNKQNQMPLENRKDLKMNHRFTYYDQAHTIGTDIAHDQTARAVLTVSEDMYIKDLLQSLWRMRKIDKGQKVDILISENVKARVIAARSNSHPQKDSPIVTMKDIILFCVRNQAIREMDDNLRGQKQRLMGFVPSQMFWQLLNLTKEDEIEIVHDCFELYQESLFKTLNTDYEQMAKVSSKDNTLVVLSKIRDNLVNQYTKIVTEMKEKGNNEDQFKQLQNDIEELQNLPFLDKEKMEKDTESVSSDAKGSQVQTQRQQQQQMSMQIQPGSASFDANDKWSQWQATDLKSLWDAADINVMPQLKKEISFIDEEVVFTPNFLPSESIMKEKNMSSKDCLTTENRVPVGQVLVMRDIETNESRVMLLDLNDYERVVANLMKPSLDGKFEAGVFDIRPFTGPFVLRSTSAAHQNPWAGDKNNWKAILSKLVKIKVFNRQVNFYSGEEIAVLKEWIKVDKDAKAIFERELLDASLQSTYSSSTLKEVFDAVV